MCFQMWVMPVKFKTSDWSNRNVPSVSRCQKHWTSSKKQSCLFRPFCSIFMHDTFPPGIFLHRQKGHSHTLRSRGHKLAISVRATHLARHRRYSEKAVGAQGEVASPPNWNPGRLFSFDCLMTIWMRCLPIGFLLFCRRHAIRLYLPI